MKKIETLIFVSNFFNHHQKPISDAFFSQLGEGYLFIETHEMSAERKKLGWGMENYPSYVISRSDFYENRAFYENLINQADIVIHGSAPNFLIKQRLKNNKTTVKYSERPLKKGFELWKYPYRFLRWRMFGFANKQHYLLCASAYTARDYSKFFLFKNRCFKWGYFPQTYRYENITHLISDKDRGSIIWAARFLQWKHPETVIKLGKRLKQEGYHFRIHMIGNGILWNDVAEMVRQEDLENEIHLLGAMTPEKVREYMEKTEIHVFTSDRNEGWGAVLNESMNSACVPVANIAIGSAPYLIENENNGFLYISEEDLYQKVKFLLDHRDVRSQMAEAAYRTIVSEWNAENASRQFLMLAEHLVNNSAFSVEGSGPCSSTK